MESQVKSKRRDEIRINKISKKKVNSTIVYFYLFYRQTNKYDTP